MHALPALALPLPLIQGCALTSASLEANNNGTYVEAMTPAVGTANVGRTVPQEAAPKIVEVNAGTASWYGPGFAGRKTASGEIFDDSKFTAAHQTLPFGSKARVTNLNNGKSVNVVINDRGPYVGDRIIDLSQAAARAIDMIEPGIVQVRIDVIGEQRDEQFRGANEAAGSP